jgi:hypothetical protein
VYKAPSPGHALHPAASSPSGSVQPGATGSFPPLQYTATRISARFRSRHSCQLQARRGACSQPTTTTHRRSTSSQLPGQQWPPASTA